MSARTSSGTAGRPVRCRLFHAQNTRKPRRCHATTVSGLTMYTAERQPPHVCASHAHKVRSTDVKRTRGRPDRCTTASWCRSAMISSCSEARERTVNRSEWSSERLSENARNLNRRNAYGVSGRHRLVCDGCSFSSGDLCTVGGASERHVVVAESHVVRELDHALVVKTVADLRLWTWSRDAWRQRQSTA